MPRAPEGQGRLTTTLQVAPGGLALGLALWKLVCPSSSRKSRVLWAPPPRPLQVPGPQPPRRGLHDKQSPLFSTSPPALQPSSRPQLSRSRHANFWPGTKGSAPAARGGQARLSHAARPAHTPLAGSALVAGGSPPPSSPATAAAPPGQPPWKPGSALRGLLGRRTGAGPTGSPARRGGGGGKDWRPRRRERGFSGLGRGTPAHPAPPLAHSLHTHGRVRGAVLVTQGKSPDKGKPRPHSAGPAPPPPLLSNPRDASPAQGRTQKGRPRFPHYQPVVTRATRGPICR